MSNDDDSGPPPLPDDMPMEVEPIKERNPQFSKMSFIGETGDLVVLILKNTLFTILSLGFYFPFAKNNIRHFFWSHVEFDGQPFEYTGNGMELFKGYIIATIYFSAFSIALSVTQTLSITAFIIIFLVYALCSSVLIPFALYGSHSYKMSRTRLRGISFRVRREGRKKFVLTFIKYCFITVLTFGFGSFWMRATLSKIRWENTYYGNLKMDYHAEGLDLLVINVFNSFMASVTLGIYAPWGVAKLVKYQANSLLLGDHNFHFIGNGKDILVLYLKNLLIIIFTLGLGVPWLIILNMRYYTDKFVYTSKLDYSNIAQVAHDSDGDALGDSMGDFIEMDFGL